MPFDEPIDPRDHAEIALLDSAVNRPFQTFDGQYLHETLEQQAAAFFHSLVCNHCFTNGNKRTAVMALDMFMIANHRCLLMSNEEIYEMAKATAESNVMGIRHQVVLARIATQIDRSAVLFELLKVEPLKVGRNNIEDINYLYDLCLREQEAICKHPLNQPQPAEFNA
jgi:death-on-curing family protein